MLSGKNPASVSRFLLIGTLGSLYFHIYLKMDKAGEPALGCNISRITTLESQYF